MLRVATAGQFERDLKRATKRGKHIAKLQTIVDLLQSGGTLPSRHRAHALKGEWVPASECHIEPDWLLVYEIKAGTLLLLRTGTHADLFG